MPRIFQRADLVEARAALDSPPWTWHSARGVRCLLLPTVAAMLAFLARGSVSTLAAHPTSTGIAALSFLLAVAGLVRAHACPARAAVASETDPLAARVDPAHPAVGPASNRQQSTVGG